MQLLTKTIQYMHVQELVKSTLRKFCLINVYASNLLAERFILWEDMRNLIVQESWLVVGDFNNVMVVEERESGCASLVQEMQPMIDCVRECGLVNMRGRGRHFTWTNNTIRSKIDNVLINERWIEEYPEVVAHFSAECLSDHAKSLICLSQSTGKRKHCF